MVVTEGYLKLLHALVGEGNLSTGVKMCFGTDDTPVKDEDSYYINGAPRYQYMVSDVMRSIVGDKVQFYCVLQATFTQEDITFKDVAIAVGTTLLCREVLEKPIVKTTKNRFEVTIKLTPTTNGMTVVGYDEVLWSEFNAD
jgi:hypothetical protein